MNQTSIQVSEDAIRKHYPTVEAQLSSGQKASGSRSGMMGYSPGGASSIGDTGSSTTLREALEGSNKSFLDKVRHSVLVDARRGGSIALAVADLFGTANGFDPLAERNRSNALVGQDLERFHQLVAARSIIAGFVTASFLSTCFEAPAGDAPEVDFEVVTTSPTAAIGAVFTAIASLVRDRADSEVGPSVWRVASSAMKAFETAAAVHMARDLAAFEQVSYAVEAESFHVTGFSHPSSTVRKGKVEIQFKKPHEVVGNHVAKSQALRLSRMLACYDPKVRSNPYVDLGGFIFTIMGDGFPGTGKTTLIQMAAGLTAENCEFAGVDFHYENFGIDQISEYQGKSGQNAKAFIDRGMDPRAVAFCTIDDIDQVAGKRDDQRSSGGQQEVTAVLMNALAGAGTIVRGNCSFGMFSNYPEKVDDALRQRAGARWLVDGPQTRVDYIDIFHLLIGKNHSIALGEHDLGAGQDIKKLVAASYEENSKPQEERLAQIYEDFLKSNGEIETIVDIGAYLHAIREAEPRFTGRAIKNVTDAIKLRAMDFDLPDAWFENRAEFFDLPYERRVELLKAQRQPITIPMIMQEINRYADSEFRYSGKSDDAAVDTMVRDMRLRRRAIDAAGSEIAS